MPGEIIVPPRTCLPTEKLEEKGGTKLVSERIAFARGSQLNEKSVSRQQVHVCAR